MTSKSKRKIVFSDVVNEKDKNRREELIDQLVSEMTLNEKLRQMGGAAKLKELTNYGSAVFRAGGCERLGVPQVKFTDGPRGVMLNSSTCFPVSMCRGATWDAALEARVGAAMGAEARSQGANLSGAVCINLLRHPAWGRAQETYGEDPVHLGVMGVALTTGIQKHIMACLKHFAANSIENSRFWVDARLDDRTLYEVYLPHFKKCVDSGAAVVMAAYNRLNGPHCCHSRRLLTEILKEEWGFGGFVISDWSFGLRSSGAASAGLDIEMPNAIFFGLPLKIKVKTGAAPIKVIDEAVKRIIRTLARFEEVGRDEEYGRDRVACAEHTRLALEVARRGIVLLKNENGVLPLAGGEANSIAVIGRLADTPNIGDEGSSRLHPPYVVTPLAGIRGRAGDSVRVEYEKGDSIEHARRAAADSDVAVVVVGLTSEDEGEFIPFITRGGDRTSLALRDADIKLIKTVAGENRNCVVVVEGGSAITMEEWIDDVPAVLMAWYPGMEGGNAVAEILFGEVNPSGKLPVTFPRSEDQLVHFNRWSRRIDYGYFHGYRHFDREKLEPRFPFGFGLSYTKYEYSNLRIEPRETDTIGKIIVTADVANTGEMGGDEIVQFYIGCPGREVERPERELKGFLRVALEPGEKKTVEFEIRPRELAYYDVKTKTWKIEPGDYAVCVGPSSHRDDLILEGVFTCYA